MDALASINSKISLSALSIVMNKIYSYFNQTSIFINNNFFLVVDDDDDAVNHDDVLPTRITTATATTTSSTTTVPSITDMDSSTLLRGLNRLIVITVHPSDAKIASTVECSGLIAASAAGMG